MAVKRFDSELKVMEVLWKEGATTAKRLCDILKESAGWNVNTTHTVIKMCNAKGAIERREPNFTRHASISKSDVQADEVNELVGKPFDGSPELLFASLLVSNTLSKEQVRRIRKQLEDME